MFSRLIESLSRFPVYSVLAADRLAALLRTDWQGRVRENAIEKLLAIEETVRHGGMEFRVLTPNRLCHYRARTFSSKEPETLEWIDGFVEPDVLWDIGANVGLYSLYAGKKHPGIRIYAFEPSILNLELLARNIDANGLSETVTIVPLPLFDSMQEDVFKVQLAERGGALSAFSVDYGYDNKPFDVALKYKVIGIGLDDIIELFGLDQPNHVKIDVDGIEHLILSGGKRVLSDPRLKSVLVELNDDFEEQKRRAHHALTEAGLVLAAKKRSEIENGAAGASVWNNIWIRP